MINKLEEFKVVKLNVQFTPLSKVTLPAFSGATIRGAFGKSLRQIACGAAKRKCADCSKNADCSYHNIINTTPKNDIMNSYERSPAPYAMQPRTDSENELTYDDILGFNMLFARKYLQDCIDAIELMGENGFGAGRGKCRLTGISVESGNGGKPYDLLDNSSRNDSLPTLDLRSKIEEYAGKHVKQLNIRFLTPVQIIYKGKPVENIEFHVLVESLLRRYFLLSNIHMGYDPKIHFSTIIESAKKVTISNNRLTPGTLSINRRGEVTDLSVLTGEVTYAGDLEAFMLYMILGSVIHVGKGTSAGMGMYEMFVKVG